MVPTKAIILAAGLGERMRPLSTHTPKAMMPFAGQPMINHTLSSLSQWGVKEVLINLHHAPDSLVEHIRTGDFPEMNISFSFEPEICGTGGALRHAAWFIGKRPFWIINSDIVFELDPRTIAVAFAKTAPLACLWVTSSAGPRTVEVKNGSVQNFSAQRPGTDNTSTFCGIHLVSPRIMEYIEDTTFSSIITAYIKAMDEGKKVRAVHASNSYWADIGSPEKLLATHIELASRAQRGLKLHRLMDEHVRASKNSLVAQRVSCNGLVSLCRNTSVSRSANLENCIIGNDSVVTSSATVSNCIVADGVTISGRVSRAAVPLAAALDREDIVALDKRGWRTPSLVCEALAPRGSDRAFYRLHGGTRPAILVKYSSVRPENEKFAQNLQFLSLLGVPVPLLLGDFPGRRINIVEDLGTVSLQSAYNSMPKHEREALYAQLIRFTAILHTKGADMARAKSLPLEPPFTAGLYAWEHALFAEHYLSGMLRLDAITIAMILKELESIPRSLKAERVLIHRDLQSSNVMLKAGRPILIDFQGMRLGSRYYDLASLLLDPYVSLPRATRAIMTKQYASLTGLDAEDVYQLTHIAGIQRLSQALGAYARLSQIPGMEHFAKHIKPATRLMSECLAHTLTLPVLADLVAS